jgi:hypothetical protein
MAVIIVTSRTFKTVEAVVIVNDDVVKAKLEELKNADTQQNFNIAMYHVDQFADALDYITKEQTIIQTVLENRPPDHDSSL